MSLLRFERAANTDTVHEPPTPTSRLSIGVLSTDRASVRRGLASEGLYKLGAREQASATRHVASAAEAQRTTIFDASY